MKISIRGYIVGSIWWPVGAKCWKDLNYDCGDQQARTVGKMTLRDHCLRASMDGDFQNCSIAQGELVIRRRRKGAKGYSTRSFPLDRFPSVSDMLHDDPDWLPSFPGDDD